jgi:hypothetical protein
MMKRLGRFLYNHSQNDSINICHFVCWHMLACDVDQSRVIKRRNIIQAPWPINI